MGGCSRLLSVLIGMALLAGACGNDTDGGSAGEAAAPPNSTASPAPTPRPAPDPTTATAAPVPVRGITGDVIELGIAYVDFDRLKNDFNVIDFTHGDEVAIWEALLADLNARGGINGRSVTAVYDTYLPIGSVEAEESCLYFTEDEQVFAVLGVWVGESVLCLTELHDTIHVGHLLRQEWIDRSTAVLATPDIVEERQLDVLLTVLETAGVLRGRTVGVLTDFIAEGSVTSVVEPFLAGTDARLASVGVMTDNQADANAIAAEIETFTEKWRTEGVDLLLVVGNNGLARIPAVRDLLGDIDVVTPSGSVLQQTSGNATAGELPRYAGVLTLAGLDPLSGEQFAEPLLQGCIGVVEAAVPGLTVVPTGELTGPDDWYAGIRDACGALAVFEAAAVAAGPRLDNDTFRAGLEGLGSIALPGSAFASFGPGKYDGDDGFRLVEFDPLVGGEGTFVPITDIVDTAG